MLRRTRILTACLVLAVLNTAGIDEAASTVPGLEIRYEGELQYEGHFRKPGETRRFLTRQSYLADGRGSIRLDWWIWAEGDSAGEPETYLAGGDKAWHRDRPKFPWTTRPDERDEPALMQVRAGVPWEFLRAAPHGQAFERGDSISVDTGGRRRRLVRGEGGRLISVRDLWPHPRLGDVADGVRYTYPAAPGVDTGLADERAPLPPPDSLFMVLHERDAGWTMSEHRVSFREVMIADSLLAAPTEFEFSTRDPDPPTQAPSLTEIAPGIWAADMEDLDTRSLVVQFADHLAVIECAVGSANGERLADAVHGHWPGLPIRYALFSHHHPHYAGGLRALMAEGATIVTTPGNEALVRDTAARRFTIQPDRFARAPRPLSVRTFDRRFELADSVNQLIAVNIGPRSGHTDEFTIFWFPRAKLLFETEQGWGSVADTLLAYPRTADFLRVLDEEGVAADRLVQSWPMRGTARELKRSELEALVQAREARERKGGGK